MSIMELSAYLKAIQEVAGSTPGEKYRTLHSIAHKILSSRNIEKSLKLLKLPEEMKPFVKVEIARKLRQSDMILEALKSENNEIVVNALKASWFFNGDNHMTTVHFYQTEIFPFLSENTRKKVISVLAYNLKDEPELADEFYELITLMYGEKQARPMLKACSESFIWSRIKNLSLKYTDVYFMYYKYPELVIEYLKLSKTDPESFNFETFSRFLPRLIKKHPEVFIELFDAGRIQSKLSIRHTTWFLDNCLDAFFKDPKKFFMILRTYVLKKKLTEEQRESLFKQLLAADQVDFKSAFADNHFEFLSDEKKLSILMSVYREEHNADFLDHHEHITPEILRILPKEDRIRIAKAKYEEDTYPGDKLNISYKKSWIAYLDCSESLQFFKSEMDVVEKSDRFEVLKRMIYTCEVNNDSESLLDVLNYIRTNFHETRRIFWANVLRFLWRCFHFMELNKDHWEIISEFLMKVIKNDKKYEDLRIKELLIEKARFDLTNMEHNISPFLQYMFRNYRDGLLKLVPTFAKISLEKLIDGIPSGYDDVNDIDIDQVVHIVQTIADFNHRSGAKVSVKDFPWLAATVKKFLVDKHGEKKVIQRLAEVLKKNEGHLYEAYVAERDRFIDFNTFNALRTLKQDPELVNRNWKVYWQKCLGHINRGSAKKFVRSLRWYQDLPIKFAEKSLDNIKNQERGLIILGLLLEGPAFERVVASIDAKNISKSCILPAISRVSPPVSLEFTLKFCEEMNVKEIGECLVNVGRKISVSKVIPFAMSLMNQKSVKKHAIKLYCLAFSIDSSN